MSNNIKIGDICTLIHNDERIFRFCGVNEDGHPLSDSIVEYVRCMMMWDTRKPAYPVVAAVTDEFRKATEREKEVYNKYTNKI